MIWTAYGLQFVSDELELPELTPAAAPMDRARRVEIVIDAVPEKLDDPGASGVLYQASADEFLLRVPNVAAYHVTRDRIVVSPTGTAGDDEVRVFLLGSAFGALLHQRGLLVLHAAAFHRPGADADDPGHAVLLAGVSGAGKSTLLGEFLRRGYDMVVDDVCAIDVIDGTATVLPGYPRTRLWADAAERLDVATDALPRTRPSLEKYERQLPEHFHATPSRFGRLYILLQHTDDELSVESVPAIDAFSAVLQNTYRRAFLEGLAMREEHFGLAAAVAAQVPVARLRRSDRGYALGGLADAIEADMAEGVAG